MLIVLLWKSTALVEMLILLLEKKTHQNVLNIVLQILAGKVLSYLGGRLLLTLLCLSRITKSGLSYQLFSFMLILSLSCIFLWNISQVRRQTRKKTTTCGLLQHSGEENRPQNMAGLFLRSVRCETRVLWCMTSRARFR